MTFEQFYRFLDGRVSDAPLVLAVDGRACSGKSTLARTLAERYGAQVISMDEFFLPLELRTPERYAEIGGNIHYERFCDEVARPLAIGGTVEYGVFDCSEMRVTHTRRIEPRGLIVVEGVYSHHPRLGNYADVTAALSISTDAQHKRLEMREPPEKVRAYLDHWIPLEERYFGQFGIIEKSDIVIDVGL